MDQKAKRFWRKHANNPRPAQTLSSAIITIAIGNHSLTHINKNTAYEQINIKPIQEYWMKKDEISLEEWEEINWQAAKNPHRNNLGAHKDFKQNGQAATAGLLE